MMNMIHRYIIGYRREGIAENKIKKYKIMRKNQGI